MFKNINIKALFIAYLIIAFMVQNHVNIYRYINNNELILTSRVWHLYVNYLDFGFIKRGVIGTLLNITGITNLIKNEFVLMLLLNYLAATTVLIITLNYLYKNKLFEGGKILLLIFLFSPGGIIHYYYWGGNLDNFLILIFTIILLSEKNIFLIGFMTILGIFCHESFAFFIPLIMLVSYEKYVKSFSIEKCIIYISFLSIMIFIAIYIVMFYGSLYNYDKYLYFEIMSQKIPITYKNVISLGELEKNLWWSGYNEISYNLNRYYKEEGLKFIQLYDNKWNVIFGTALAIYLPLIAAFYFSKNKFIYNLISFIALIFPMFMAILANDYWRYTSFTMIVSILYIYHQLKENNINKVSNRSLLLILPFCLLGPYGGSDLYAPFHLTYVIFSKF